MIFQFFSMFLVLYLYLIKGVLGIVQIVLYFFQSTIFYCGLRQKGKKKLIHIFNSRASKL